VSTACAASLGFDTLRLEGALLLPDLLEKAAQGKASGQTDADYHIPRGYTPQEEIGRAFRIAQAQWKVFSSAFERTDLDAAVTTRAFVEEFLRDALGYVELHATPPVEVAERRFPIAAFAALGIPLVIAPHGLDLDEPDAAFAPLGGGARRKSPFQLLQEFLNAERSLLKPVTRISLRCGACCMQAAPAATAWLGLSRSGISGVPTGSARARVCARACISALRPRSCAWAKVFCNTRKTSRCGAT
jgi:hypothetical protein